MAKDIQNDTSDIAAQLAEHFVYIYRDERGKPRYVGYGSFADRATSHSQRSHNPVLAKFLATHRYVVEIAGPYGSEAMGRAVETALISTLHPDINKDPGPSQWRFRPLGVPVKYGDRLTQPELVRRDFMAKQGRHPVPILFVIVTDKDFTDEDCGDGRPGYDIAAPPTDLEIRERVEKWWQVSKKRRDKWAANPNDSPGLLLGIHGRPGAQFVIASLLIDRKNWATADIEGGKIRIPLLEPGNLDAHGLRGRRIARSARIAFGNWAQQFYLILGRDGKFR